MKETRYIEHLENNEIFVFGSNLSGRHGRGAAKTALKFGAIYGKAEGIQGNSYAIPTVNKYINGPLPLKEIQIYVNNFYEYAKEHQEYIFLITEIGCGLAGLTVEEIAPLFKKFINLSNITLPSRFIYTYKMNDGNEKLL